MNINRTANRHFSADASLECFVASLPKTETHLHLEGSVSFEQLHEFDPVRYPNPPPFWDKGFRFHSFDQFQSAFEDWIVPYHSSIERYQTTARHVFAQCRAHGCRYVETSFHLPAINWLGVSGPDLLDAIIEAAPSDMEVRIFGGLGHGDYQIYQQLFEDALSWDQLAGIDLHGPEDLPVDEAIPDYWRRAKLAGKTTKAHAGEFMPASFVDWIIDNLQVDRIEHGVRAIESEAVVEKIVARDIVLDVCPISNMKLAVAGAESVSSHPIRQLIDSGVTVTLSTDDTFLFGNNLSEEYYGLALELGFTPNELKSIARNGIRTSLLTDLQKQELETELGTIE